MQRGKNLLLAQLASLTTNWLRLETPPLYSQIETVTFSWKCACILRFKFHLHEADWFALMCLDTERAEWRHRSAGHGQWPHWRDRGTNFIQCLYIQSWLSSLFFFYFMAAHACAYKVIIFCPGSFFPFFRTPFSEVTVRSFNKLYHVFRREPDLKMDIQIQRFFSHKTSEPKTTYSAGSFTTTSRLWRECLRNETWIDKQNFFKLLTLRSVPLHSAEIEWTLARKEIVSRLLSPPTVSRDLPVTSACDVTRCVLAAVGDGETARARLAEGEEGNRTDQRAAWSQRTDSEETSSRTTQRSQRTAGTLQQTEIQVWISQRREAGWRSATAAFLGWA